MTTFPWSHFYVSNTGRVKLFSCSDCEHCGMCVQVPNAVTGCDNPDLYRQLGLTEYAELPPEIWYDEALGYTSCDHCQGASLIASDNSDPLRPG